MGERVFPRATGERALREKAKGARGHVTVAARWDTRRRNARIQFQCRWLRDKKREEKKSDQRCADRFGESAAWKR